MTLRTVPAICSDTAEKALLSGMPKCNNNCNGTGGS